MSLESWKREFYPVPAPRAKEWKAAAHSLRKWIGLSRANLKRHGLEKADGSHMIKQRGGGLMMHGTETCALCCQYDDGTEENSCGPCPLYAALDNDKCAGDKNDVYGKWLHRGHAGPMIRALRKAVKIEAARGKKP